MKQLRPYQAKAVTKMLTQNTLLQDHPGLGKTLQAITTALGVFEFVTGPCLIVCPKAVRLQWIAEITENDPHQYPIITLEATTELPKRFSAKPFWIICHYEALIKLWPSLRKSGYSTIVADEAHRIKNRKALRSKALKKLICYRKLALTATPFDKNPSDVWSIINWLYPKQFTSYWAFFEAHTLYELDRKGYRRIKGCIDPKALANVLRPFTIKRTKRSVAPELPAKIVQNVELDMLPAQLTAYKSIADRVTPLVEVNQDTELVIKNALTHLLRLQQVTTDPALLGYDAESVKLTWLDEWLADHPDQSVLILTKFRETANKIAAKHGLALVTGASKPLNPKQHDRIVGTIGAMAEGLDLGHIGTTIFIDLDFSSIKMYQAVDRTERDLTAVEPKHIIYLYCTNSIDLKIARILASKQSLAEMVEDWLQSLPRNTPELELLTIAVHDAIAIFGGN